VCKASEENEWQWGERRSGMSGSGNETALGCWCVEGPALSWSGFQDEVLSKLEGCGASLKPLQVRGDSPVTT